MKTFHAVLILLIVNTVPNNVSAKSKFISISLDSKWYSTPLILEASEYLAKEGKDLFWSFVEELTSLGSDSIADHHDEAMYHLIEKLSTKYLTSRQIKLLKFSLSLRAYSPTIEMYNQIAHDIFPSRNCEVFVQVNGRTLCTVDEIEAELKIKDKKPPSTIFDFDHHYPGAKNGTYVVMLYGDMRKQSFHDLYFYLRMLVENGEVDCVFRHYIKKLPEAKTRLSGYGVELAIKSTEYKAKDDTKVKDDEGDSSKGSVKKEEEVQGFIFSTLREQNPELKDKLKEFQQHMIDSTHDMAPLKVWQLQDLSYQAAQKILSADPTEALNVMMDVSQNFPSKARALAKVTVNPEMKKEVQNNQKYFEQHYGLGAGESALYINGIHIDLDTTDIFMILDTLKSETKIMEGLYSLNIKSPHLEKILKLDLSSGEGENYAIDIRDSSVQYINNLEEDSKYRDWPSSLTDLLRPTWPGMLRHVRKNIYNLIFLIDPSEKRSRDILKMAESFFVHSAPMRVGVVFVVSQGEGIHGKDDAGVALLRAFNFISQDSSPAKGLSFITDVYEKVGSNIVEGHIVVSEFKSVYPGEDYELVFGSNSDYDDGRKTGYEFHKRSGLGDIPQVLLNGIPLKESSLTSDAFEEAVISEIMSVTPAIQKAVYTGKLSDGMSVIDYMMDKENVMPRLNSRILSAAGQYIRLGTSADADNVNKVEHTQTFSNTDLTSSIAASMKYLTRKEDDALLPISHWVVADMSSTEGRALLYNAIKQLKHSNEGRLGLVHNPTSVSSKDNYIALAIQVALETLPKNIAKSFVTKLLKEENVEALKDETKKLEDLEVNGMDMDEYKKALRNKTTDYLVFHQIFSIKVLGFVPGQKGIITNGKVIGPLSNDEEFTVDDFSLIEKYSMKMFGTQVKEIIKQITDMDLVSASDLAMKVTSLLLSQSAKANRKDLHFDSDQHSAVSIVGNPNEPAFEVTAIFDPLSREGQRITPLLVALPKIVNSNIKVFMNCKEKLSEMPLKSYYRYVLEPEVKFSVDGSLSSGPIARFENMPTRTLLTVHVTPPESWLVEAVLSPHDLDNIFLDEVESGVTAQFQLSNLLLEGHCYDSATSQPPRGLQFTLGTDSKSVMVDTIVMANLGYFQLKANPGAWQLRLRSGRSSEIYDISSHEYTNTPPDSPNITVVLESFHSKIIKVKVSKKPDKLKEDLLGGGDEEDDSLWGSLSNTFTGGGKKEEVEEDKDQTLNIFSLASGHLYERFLRIMMLSVIKNSKSKVKFWFLKNYLSPSFKNFIPHMASQYGFEYELVQYKWPRWLHQQTDKQRIIWGYKILFLDVLFPLDVKKIIFVDADQIVRADLQELYDLDLEGAPYGYTPFCDSRKEMDGFRFWTHGYWASHLAGRRYHISALYVVDLKKFRKIAAGDRLRGQYQGLSQDPNSLANLDQDLPNNMIHQVQIKSLPQEWLWCETWCSDEEKTKAKTIDLCNNPQTKEPKLEAAVRIVPEWTDYDNEQKELWEKIMNKDINSDINKEIDTDEVKDNKEADNKDSNKDVHEEL